MGRAEWNSRKHERGQISIEDQGNGYLKAVLWCSCGRQFFSQEPIESEALEALNIEWLEHSQAYAPLAVGETVRLNVLKVQGSGGYKAVIDSPDNPRRFALFWEDPHLHATRADAEECGTQELFRWQ